MSNKILFPAIDLKDGHPCHPQQRCCEDAEPKECIGHV